MLLNQMSDGGESDGDDAVVRLAEAKDDQDVYIRLFSSPSSSSSSSVVCAPAAWLSDIPYFATRLTEPWIDSSPPQHIELQCTLGTSPHDYLQCLLLLRSSPTRWPLLLASVSEVLRILPVADHLLFQECWDACMGFLASSPWSIDEEDAIRATISTLNMEPSPDVKERLDTSYDGTVLEALFHTMLSTTSLEASFGAWCEKCLNHSSAPFAAAFNSILLKVMQSLSANAPDVKLSREWYVLAKILFQFTDAEQFTLYLVDSEDLLKALAQQHDDSQTIFHNVLENVEKRVVLLSNLQRARLLKWSRPRPRSRCVPIQNKSSTYHDLRLRLAETLPFRDPARIEVMKSSSQHIAKWIDQVSHRVSLMDEAGLKAVCEDFEKK